MQYRECEGPFCGITLREVGNVDQWVGRWNHKMNEGVVAYTPDPFEEEIHGKEIMMWLCEYCWYGLHDEI
jgi:hypothetical protein